MIYYIHGYLSSPDGTKGQLFKKTLHAIPIKYRDVEPEDLIIKGCVKQIERVISNDEKVILIGSSLGGLLAAKISMIVPVSQLILINPAIIPLSYDLSKIQDMPQRIIHEMYDVELFAEKIESKITLLIGTNDSVVSNKWGIEFAKYHEASIQFYHDDHQFSKNIDKLPEIIKNIISA